ncbi:MAG TPA: DNA internalization-related competence protein ComEC/Rec2 [Azospira sp.]|nr:DNA internalization-related competence protein ComEC/Rec2 [Azospira sp.]
MNSAILAFALGVGLVQLAPRLPDWPLGWVVAGLLALPVLAASLPPAKTRTWRRGARMVWIAWSLAFGLAWAAWLAQGRLAEQLPSALEGVDIPVIGVVASLPQEFPRGLRFEFRLDSRQGPDGLPLPGNLLLSWYGTREAPAPTLVPGQRWQLTLRLKRPHGNANPHGFDYEAWLLERNLRATGYVRTAADGPAAPRLLGSDSGLLLAVEQLRYAVRERFRAWLPEADYPYGGILTALAVGDQRAIAGQEWRIFARTGTTHLMSVSGLHITLVAALGAGLAGWLWRRWPRLLLLCPARRVEIIAGWWVAGAYTLLAGSAVPALRTWGMLTAAALALLSGRVVGAGKVLSFALLAVLLYDPWGLLAPGFWLSFVAVGALLLLAREHVHAHHAQHGLQEKGQSTGATKLREWLSGLRQALPGQLARWGAAQWAATLGTLPLLLLFFQQFSLVSPLANALAIPLVSLVVTPLALGAAVLPFPWLATLAHGLLSGLMLVLAWLADWPGAVWSPPAPDTPALILGCLGVAWLLLPRGFPARWLGALLLLPLGTEPPPRPADGEAWVTVLDVGQGLAAAVRTARHTLLYDSGPYYSAESDAGQRIVVPWLRAEGVGEVDGLMLTHRDTDHSGGARSLLESLTVAWVADSLEATPEGLALAALSDGARQRRRCFAGQAWEWDGVRFAVLHPAWDDYAQPAGKSNHMSCVLRVEAGGHAVLLTSDIEAPDEAALLARDAPVLKSDVLLVPHHGSRTSSTPAFIQAVGAGEVIFPVGYRNRFGHPKADVVERYGEARQWRTDRDGAIHIRLGKGRPVLAAEREERRRYWHGQ